MVLLVMVCSPNLEVFLGRIQELPEPLPQTLGESIRKMVDWDSLSSEENLQGTDGSQSSHADRSASSALPSPDPRREIFALEEQVAKAVAQLQRRNREFESLEGEHQLLSESVARLQETNVSCSVLEC